MRPGSVVVLALVLVVPVSAATLGITILTPTSYLVGYPAGDKSAATSLVGSLGGSVTGTIDALRVLEVSSTVDLASLLAGSSVISFAEKDAATGETGAQWDGAQWNGAQWNGAQWNAQTTSPAGMDPGAIVQWGLAASDTPAAWALDPGQGAATLCVVDSGVDASHPDLAADMWTASDGSHGYNAITGTTDASDDAGHGTHMAGIAAALHGNGIGVSGVANDRIMSIKVLDSKGHGTTSDLAEGLVWCADHGGDVALLALSVDGQPQTIARALDYLSARNVVVVASAGNQGPCTDCVAYPARAPGVIAVSALGPTGQLAPFSSQGSQVALGAPGVNITSTFPGGAYATGSGTSQAAAWVAGAATLIRDAHPGLAPANVRSALASSANASTDELDTAAALASASG